MTRRRRRFIARVAGCDGAALVLALVVLVGLSAITVALLSVASMEPHVARNHVDAVRARYLAESGIATAYDTLVLSAGRWSDHLAGATCTTGAVLLEATLPGRPRTDGYYTVSLRNDCAPGDGRLTGASAADTNPTQDMNGKVVVSSTGVVGRISQTITTVVSDERELRDSGQSVPRSMVKAYNWADD